MVQETRYLAESLGYTNLETQVGDVLRAPLPKRFDLCVSNLPYKVSAPFIFRLFRRLSEAPPWRTAVLMLQKEFAERLLADPGEKNFSRLAVNARLFAKTLRICDVKPGSFIPQPQVQSTVVKLEPRLPLPAVDFDEWDALIKTIFGRRRKTMRSQFTKQPTLSMLEQNYKFRCSAMGLPPANCSFPDLVNSVLVEECALQSRAFAMDIDDIYRLLLAFNRKGIFFSSVVGQIAGEPRPMLDLSPDDSDDEDDPHSLLRPGRQVSSRSVHSSHRSRSLLASPPPPHRIVGGDLTYP